MVKKKDLKNATGKSKRDFIQNEDQGTKSARESKTGETFGIIAMATVGSNKAKKDLHALEESA